MNLTEETKKNPFAPILTYFNYFMAIIYMCGGIMLLTTNMLSGLVSGSAKTITGILLIVYGIFRGYRIFRTRDTI